MGIHGFRRPFAGLLAALLIGALAAGAAAQITDQEAVPSRTTRSRTLTQQEPFRTQDQLGTGSPAPLGPTSQDPFTTDPGLITGSDVPRSRDLTAQDPLLNDDVSGVRSRVPRSRELTAQDPFRTDEDVGVRSRVPQSRALTDQDPFNDQLGAEDDFGIFGFQGETDPLGPQGRFDTFGPREPLGPTGSTLPRVGELRAPGDQLMFDWDNSARGTLDQRGLTDQQLQEQPGLRGRQFPNQRGTMDGRLGTGQFDGNRGTLGTAPQGQQGLGTGSDVGGVTGAPSGGATGGMGGTTGGTTGGSTGGATGGGTGGAGGSGGGAGGGGGS